MPLKTKLNRMLSLSVVIFYLIIYFNQPHTHLDWDFAKIFFGLLIILSLIWYGDAWGKIKKEGASDGSHINVESPGCLVCLLGWIFLVGIPIIFWLFLRVGKH
jgi:hypothetical protein